MEVMLRLFFALLFVVRYCHGRSNGSGEHLVRKAMLDGYDKNVLPSAGSVVHVEFGLKVNKLIKVENKDQLLTLDTWVIMIWNNTFFSWKPADYKATNRVQFLPTEIWFPDIALYNNGDDETPRAGGTSKFLSNVVVNDKGLCIWSGPATFVVSCDMRLKTYPFDLQQCDMRFGSFSYASNQLDVHAFKTKKAVGDRFLPSGDWDLSEIHVREGETDHGNCCPYKFKEIVYSIKMRRRFQYHMFYLIGPCLMLAILTLFSFWIPSETGERVGFVTTLLLGMMVFLLLVPESLPESSKAIPTLGILMMGTLVMIACALVVTITILSCFYSKRTPPKCLRKLFGSSKKYNEKPTGEFEIHENGVGNINLRAVPPALKGSRPVHLTLPRETEDEIMWQQIANKFDIIMFWVFMVATIAMYAMIMTMRRD